MATTIYATNDGRVVNFETTNWTDTRDATSGNTASVVANLNDMCQVSKVAGGRGGGTTYGCARGFFQFDTTSITHVPKAANIMIYGYSTSGAGTMYGVKSTQSGSLAASDFDAIDGWQTGGVDNISNVTIYTDLVGGSWDTSDYNRFTLTQQALVDIAGMTTFKIAVCNFANDIRAIEPSTATNRSGCHTSAYVGTTRDPSLIITEQDNSVFFGCNF